MTDRWPSLQTTLVALCAMLAMVFLYEILAPLPALDAPATFRNVRLPQASVAAFNPPPASKFEATVRRPIFSPTRQPVQPRQAAVAETELPPPDVTLLGVIIDGERKLALVRAPEFPFATTVSVGGTVGGWRVAQVDSTGIVLQSGSRLDQVALNAKTGAASASTEEPFAKVPGP